MLLLLLVVESERGSKFTAQEYKRMCGRREKPQSNESSVDDTRTQELAWCVFAVSVQLQARLLVL